MPLAPPQRSSGSEANVRPISAATTDFNRNTTTFTLDSHGNVLRETWPDGSHEDGTYNSAGQVLTDTDPNGNTTTYTYDSLGRLTSVIRPGETASTATRCGYDAAGDLTSVTDELGKTTRYTYDLAGRVLLENNGLACDGFVVWPSQRLREEIRDSGWRGCVVDP